MNRFASRLALVTLLLLAATGMVMQAGSLPHVHAAGAHAGMFNEEHDLTLLAGFAAQSLLVGAAPAITFDTVSTLIPPYVPERPAARLARSGASRAPPLV
jgi:hypothetical protein